MRGTYIFVLDRGFVVVVRAELHPELAFHWKAFGRTIRGWGTTEVERVVAPAANMVQASAANHLAIGPSG